MALIVLPNWIGGCRAAKTMLLATERLAVTRSLLEGADGCTIRHFCTMLISKLWLPCWSCLKSSLNGENFVITGALSISTSLFMHLTMVMQGFSDYPSWKQYVSLFGWRRILCLQCTAAVWLVHHTGCPCVWRWSTPFVKKFLPLFIFYRWKRPNSPEQI